MQFELLQHSLKFKVERPGWGAKETRSANLCTNKQIKAQPLGFSGFHET